MPDDPVGGRFSRVVGVWGRVVGAFVVGGSVVGVVGAVVVVGTCCSIVSVAVASAGSSGVFTWAAARLRFQTDPTTAVGSTFTVTTSVWTPSATWASQEHTTARFALARAQPVSDGVALTIANEPMPPVFVRVSCTVDGPVSCRGVMVAVAVAVVPGAVVVGATTRVPEKSGVCAPAGAMPKTAAAATVAAAMATRRMRRRLVTACARLGDGPATAPGHQPVPRRYCRLAVAA